jgi:hypothetical protein
MKRINSILSTVVEDKDSLDNKVKRVENAFKTAHLNAESDLIENNKRKVETLKKLSEDKNSMESVLDELLTIFKKQKEIKDSLECLDEMEKWLIEEVE